MTVLIEHDVCCLRHDNGLAHPNHPERPARLTAVVRGLEAAEIGTTLVWAKPRPATMDDLVRVHKRNYIVSIRNVCKSGGGPLTPYTGASRDSWPAALAAAGSGLDAVSRLECGEADAAFCVVRPPGHHALADQASGFCLFNNVAICAAALANRGERVLIVDWDAHHGNGTQNAFYEDCRVLYISMHQSPSWPGTGGIGDTGAGGGVGYTINFPLPAKATGDVYLAALDVIAPTVDAFDPTWVLVSAGFDSHRDDTLQGTNLGLSVADFADLTRYCRTIVPGRLILFLEGGYNLNVLAESSRACVVALAGSDQPVREERPTQGGPGMGIVAAVRKRIVG